MDYKVFYIMNMCYLSRSIAMHSIPKCKERAKLSKSKIIAQNKINETYIKPAT